jgi:hypothetical protein
LDPELECSDEYGLGARESLQEAIQAVSTILGMQPCEVRNVTQNFPFLGAVMVNVRRGYDYVLFVHQSLFLMTVALVIVFLVQMLLVTNTTALQLH